MTYRTEQDKINRKEANQRYYKLEENKQQKRDYVKVKAHEQYIQKKIDDAQLDTQNEQLNIINSEGFVDGAQR